MFYTLAAPHNPRHHIIKVPDIPGDLLNPFEHRKCRCSRNAWPCCALRLQRHNDRRRKRLEDDVQPQYIPKKIRELAPDEKMDYGEGSLPTSSGGNEGATTKGSGRISSANGLSPANGNGGMMLGGAVNNGGLLSALAGGLNSGSGGGSGSWGLHMLADLAHQDNSQGAGRPPPDGAETEDDGAGGTADELTELAADDDVGGDGAGGSDDGTGA